MLATPILLPMLEKLKRWAPLSQHDVSALLALPHTVRSLKRHELIVRDEDRPSHCCLLLSGYAFRHKIISNGARQIFSIHMRGDVVDLHNSVLGRADHNVETLTAVEVAMIPIEAIREIAASNPAVGYAMWYETLVDASIFREWTLNIGRRDARSRMAHLLCEFALRLELAGLGEAGNYELPMTQEELADALAITNVHVNRTLRTLMNEGLIERAQRAIKIADFARLASVGDFNNSYLHLEGSYNPR